MELHHGCCRFSRHIARQELRQLYDTEQRLTKAIPRLVEASSNSDLINALKKHLNETRATPRAA